MPLLANGAGILLRAPGVFSCPPGLACAAYWHTMRSAKGTRLRVFAGLGTIVGSGDHIATLIPARDQMITRALAKQAERTLRTRSCSRVEEVATGAVARTQMALDLANVGDIGTARTVTQNVVRLVAKHTAAAREARTQCFGGKNCALRPPPVVCATRSKRLKRACGPGTSRSCQ